MAGKLEVLFELNIEGVAAQGRKAGQAAHRAAYEDFIAAAHRA